MLSKAEIQRVRALHRKKGRDEAGRFLVEGEKSVLELLASDFGVDALYATPAWLQRQALSGGKKAVRAVPASEEQLARMSALPSPQPVIAVAFMGSVAFDPSSLNRGFTIALDDLQDPGNVGTILRLADWYRFDRVICSEASVDPHHPKLISASMGSFFRIPFWEAPLAEILAQTQSPVFGCDLEGENVHRLAPCSNAVLVIGNEGRGLSAEVRAQVDQFITIPRFGRAESLNAAIAAAIICDNLVRVSDPNLLKRP